MKDANLSLRACRSSFSFKRMTCTVFNDGSVGSMLGIRPAPASTVVVELMKDGLKPIASNFKDSAPLDGLSVEPNQPWSPLLCSAGTQTEASTESESTSTETQSSSRTSSKTSTQTSSQAETGSCSKPSRQAERTGQSRANASTAPGSREQTVASIGGSKSDGSPTDTQVWLCHICTRSWGPGLCRGVLVLSQDASITLCSLNTQLLEVPPRKVCCCQWKSYLPADTQASVPPEGTDFSPTCLRSFISLGMWDWEKYKPCSNSVHI